MRLSMALLRYNYIVIFLIGIGPYLHAQLTIEDIDDWIENKPYQDPKLVDSILIWSAQLEEAGGKLGYARGVYYAERFRGFHHDFNGDIDKGINSCLKFLRGAQESNHQIDITSAISDLVYTYITIGQHDKAKPLLLKVINDAKTNNLDQKQLSAYHNNLGIVYKRTGQLDSAAWAYNKSLLIKEAIGDDRGLMDLKINLSSLYEALGDYEKTITLSKENLKALGKDGNAQDIIHNLSNLASGLSNTGRNKEAEEQLIKADSISTSLDNIHLKEQTSKQLSIFYYHTKQHDKAYEELLKSTTLKSEILNEQSNLQIGELRESYEAEKRELENEQLSSELVTRNNQIKLSIAGLLSLLFITSVIAWFWRANRRKNILLEEQNNQINQQNVKLKQLNQDKNNLISLVSHDLSGPFTAIKVWAQGITKQSSASSIEETKTALVKISDRALTSINRVLSIDKAELHSLEITTSNLAELISTASAEGVVIAKEKSISVNFIFGDQDLDITTDKSMLTRIIKNLLSNAIKYSEPNTVIDISTRSTEDLAIVEIKDQGIGMSPEDQKTIFNRYDQGSASPTRGEESRGLGLSIVERLVDEIGGMISVKSVLGEGSIFTLRLPL